MFDIELPYRDKDLFKDTRTGIWGSLEFINGIIKEYTIIDNIKEECNLLLNGIVSSLSNYTIHY